MSRPSCEVVGSHVLPLCDFVDRSRMAVCSRTLRRAAAMAKDGVEVRRRWAAALLARAGAPECLLRHLDAGSALRWMERRDLVRAGTTGYIDYLTPRDFGARKPVTFGLDPCGRFYVAASFAWNERTGVACLFQRYSDVRYLFVNCVDCISREVFTSNLDSRGESHLSEHHANVLELISRGSFAMPSGELVYLAA
jgi:hypothetical protein